jgi:hypothetical protein
MDSHSIIASTVFGSGYSIQLPLKGCHQTPSYTVSQIPTISSLLSSHTNNLWRDLEYLTIIAESINTIIKMKKSNQKKKMENHFRLCVYYYTNNIFF